MGAGILPTGIYNNKIYFLFGKENKNEKSAPGFSDFGGGSEPNESYLDTAVREGVEELTGFLGTSNDVKKLLKKHGTYNLDLTYPNHSIYRVHIFPFNYDANLPYYYNNNQLFLQKKIPDVIKNTKIFEKSEIKWICIDDLLKSKSKFRHFFEEIIDKIIDEKAQIKKFIFKSIKTINKHKSIKNKTRKHKR